MVGKENSVEAKPKRVSKLPAKQAQVVKNMLTKMEKKMAGKDMKATVADYIRLLQLHKELDDQSPKEIRVTWVEPVTESGKEE